LRKKIIILIVSIFIVSGFITWGINASLRSCKTGRHQKLNHIFNDTTHYDLTYFGTSRVAFNINPKNIQSNILSSYNAGITGINAQITLAVIKDFIKNHGKPKYAVVGFDFYVWESENTNMVYEPYRFLPYLQGNLFSTLKGIDPKFYLYKYIYPYRLTQYDDWIYYEAFRSFTDKTIAFDNEFLSNGYQIAPRNQSSNFQSLRKDFKINPQLKEEKKAVIEIFEYLRNLDIKTIGVIFPLFSESQEFFMSDSTNFNFLDSLCSQHNAPLLNYLDLDLTKNKDLFYDEIHLNPKGVAELNSFISKDLEELLK